MKQVAGRHERKKAQRRARRAGIALNPYRFDTWPGGKCGPVNTTAKPHCKCKTCAPPEDLSPLYPPHIQMIARPTLQQVQALGRGRRG